MENFLNTVSFYLPIAKHWLMTKMDSSIATIAFIIGILTFSSWASFLLSLLCILGIYLIEKKISSNIRDLINFDYKSFFLNVIIGLVSASFMLLFISLF